MRLARLSDRLRERRWKVSDLARAEAVSRRSIERDLQALEFELGEALEVDADRRYRIVTRPPALTEGEALALYSAARLLTQTGVGERHYRSAMTKLAQQLPEPARLVLLERIATLAPALHDRIVDQVAQAWFRQRVLRCRHRSVEGTATALHEVEVYSVELGHRSFPSCLLGFDRVEGTPVVLELARLEDVSVLNATFEVPPDFDPEALLVEAYGASRSESVEALVRVGAPAAALFIELAGSALRSVEKNPDGSVDTTLSGTPDALRRALGLIPWLLGWGDAIEVVAPEEMREALATAHTRAALRYRGH